MNGYIKLHRKVLENPIVFKDSDHLTLWIYLLLTATHRDRETYFNNERFTLNPGQLITGIIKLEREIKVNKSKIQRILKLFENEKQIEQQTTNKCRLITILGWQKYQIVETCEKQNDKQVKSKWKLNNNNKNNKNIYIYQKFEEFWSIYPRKVGKKKAIAAFSKIKNLDMDKIKKSIVRYKNTDQWKTLRYVPHPATWLNQERWEDEVIEDQKVDIQNQVVRRSPKKTIVEDEISAEEYKMIEIEKKKLRGLMSNLKSNFNVKD